MIVQTAPAGEPQFVVDQLEHTRLAGRFAAAWGNPRFAPLAPRELMLFVVTHHDEGWDLVDAAVGRDAETGLPWNLVKTPLAELMKTGPRGPDLNEAHHPYCGLISSMHSYGLYHGRYGLSDKVFVNMISADQRPAVDAMLAGEIRRQERLKAALAGDPEMAPWIEEKALFHNYKLLQFFDTLSLYFNCTHEAARGTSTFPNVPRGAGTGAGDDVMVTVSRKDKGVYRVDPYPFATDGIDFSFSGRFMRETPEGTDMRAALAALPVEVETMKLVSQ